MKLALIVLSLLGLLWQAQVPQPLKEVALDEEFTVKVGEQIEIKDINLRITFRSVQEDSRCPVDVTCVWAGNAKLSMEVKRSKKKFIEASLNTTLNPQEIEFKGYTVKLLRVTPERKANASPEPADYEATLVVSEKGKTDE
jgi:hypothetical protein